MTQVPTYKVYRTNPETGARTFYYEHYIEFYARHKLQEYQGNNPGREAEFTLEGPSAPTGAPIY